MGLRRIGGLALLIAGPALAQAIVCVDVEGDRIVRVDAQSGEVSAIGALGVDVDRADLTVFGGVLYMVSNSDGGSDTRLYSVSPNTGEAVFCCDISSDSNGRSIEFGEALTADGDGLILGYDARVDADAQSFVFGRIEDGGDVQQVTVLSGCPGVCDSDGAAYDPQAEVVMTVDGVETEDRNDWALFELASGELFNADSVDRDTAMGLINDVVIDGDLAFGIAHDPDGGSGALLTFSRDGSEWDLTGVTPLAGNPGVLRGIALATPNDCPADIDGDGDADASDFFGYLDLFAAGDDRADLDDDGDIDAEDFFSYLDLFAAGC